MKAVVLVALSGCWHFQEEPPTEQPTWREARRGPVRYADAREPDAEPDVEPAAARAGIHRRPPIVADAGVVQVPPNCLLARVISVTIQGSEIILVLARGSQQGVARSWTVTLTDPAATPAKILRVDKSITVIKVSGLTMDMIRTSPTAILCP